MAKAARRERRGRGFAWTKSLEAELRRHSKARTPVARIAKLMKRTESALRQQAYKMGVGLGHLR